MECSESAIAAAGSSKQWDLLSPAEQSARNKSTYAKLLQTIGEEEFQKLIEEEKSAIDLFIWAGCCMHKELNTFKAGCKAFPGFWKSNNLEPPVKLMNKDNRAAAELGNASTKGRADTTGFGSNILLRLWS